MFNWFDDKEPKKSVGHKRVIQWLEENGRRVGRPPADSELSFSVECQIRNERGLNHKVYQKAFLLIHGFGKRRLEILHKKMPVGSAVPEADRRGKHNSRPHKVSEEHHQKVRDHIMSFPTRQSHYSRHDNHGRLYLAPELSIPRLYQMFLAEHDPEYVAYVERRREALISHQEIDIVERKPIVSEQIFSLLNSTFIFFYLGQILVTP